MHELSVMESLLKLAADHAARAGARRVTELVVVIGEMSSCIDDSISFYWDLISKGTVCEGARLRFERVGARFTCQDCGAVWGLQGEMTCCPKCSSARLRITEGMEFRLDSIVIDEDDAADPPLENRQEPQP
jgi:hydrogenase nickel incorporation protein HypA/HybF